MGPLVLLFKWKDSQRWWFLTGYLAAILINALISLNMAVGTRATNPLALILWLMAWARAYKVWRVRRRAQPTPSYPDNQ